MAGWWYAQAIAFDAGYNMKEYSEASEYAIHGGHRTSEAVGGKRDMEAFDCTSLTLRCGIVLTDMALLMSFISSILFRSFGVFTLLFLLRKDRRFRMNLSQISRRSKDLA